MKRLSARPKYLEVANLEVFTREAHEGYIRRTIGSVLGGVKIRKLGADSLDSLYTALKKCSRLCRRLPRVEHHTVGEHARGARCGPLRDHRTTRPHVCDSRCRPHACQPMKPATILRIHSIISSALDLALRYDWADRNVAKNASPPHPRKREPDPPSPDQAAELQRRGHESAPTQTPQPQSTLQWRQELEVSIEAVDRALACQQQAAIDVGLPWPPVRHPAAQPEAERSPQLENSVPRRRRLPSQSLTVTVSAPHDWMSCRHGPTTHRLGLRRSEQGWTPVVSTPRGWSGRPTPSQRLTGRQKHPKRSRWSCSRSGRAGVARVLVDHLPGSIRYT